MFNNIYFNKRILITGNTGFKGSWLTIWLLNLGAKIYGISNGVPTKPSIFEELSLEKKITYYKEDVRNLDLLKCIVDQVKPDFIFHLAAQPIVRLSYLDPIETISTNVIGTMNIIESVRVSAHKCCLIIITSDKCYDNMEWNWGYRENDPLGGKDPYSASKGAAELIVKTYYHSFFKFNSEIKIISVRAGNVIGGGDWARDRIVPDCAISWSQGKPVEIRNPDSTRPWQHVLEPLSGYLQGGSKLSLNSSISGESYNFGPSPDQNYSVLDVLKELEKYWDLGKQTEPFVIKKESANRESGLLKLCCDKALNQLNWKPTLTFEETAKFTSEWYCKFYKNRVDMFQFTIQQINRYCELAAEKGLEWVK